MNEQLKPYYETLVKYSEFFDKWNKEKYIGRDNEGIVAAIWGAYKQINPSAKDPFGCTGCVKDMLFYANINRVTYMQSQLKRETFPKHKKK